MIASLAIGVISDRHEIAQLGGKPQVEEFRVGPDDVSADKDVQHAGDERKLLPSTDRLGVVPSCA